MAGSLSLLGGGLRLGTLPGLLAGHVSAPRDFAVVGLGNVCLDNRTDTQGHSGPIPLLACLVA